MEIARNSEGNLLLMDGMRAVEKLTAEEAEEFAHKLLEEVNGNTDPKDKHRQELPMNLSVESIIGITGFGQTKVYQLINSGTIPGAKKVMGSWIIPRESFLEWFYSAEDGHNEG